MVSELISILIFPTTEDTFSAWIGVGGVIFGTILGAILSPVITSFSESRKEKRIKNNTLNQLLGELILLNSHTLAVKPICFGINDNVNPLSSFSEEEVKQLKRIIGENDTYLQIISQVDILSKKYLELTDYSANIEIFYINSFKIISSTKMLYRYISEINFEEKHLLQKMALWERAGNCSAEIEVSLKEIKKIFRIPEEEKENK